jgi:hypothetical protein
MSESSESWIAQLLSNATNDVTRLHVRKVLEVCPYRSFVGPVPLRGADFDVLARHVGGVFAMPDLKPTAIEPDRMDAIQEILAEGKAVLILTRSDEVGARARREILARYDLVRPGTVQ